MKSSPVTKCYLVTYVYNMLSHQILIRLPETTLPDTPAAPPSNQLGMDSWAP